MTLFTSGWNSNKSSVKFAAKRDDLVVSKPVQTYAQET